VGYRDNTDTALFQVVDQQVRKSLEHQYPTVLAYWPTQLRKLDQQTCCPLDFLKKFVAKTGALPLIEIYGFG